ncbi:MAG: hypothetical protein PF961_10210 [Planctomycetota bacterium]|nr:hypothetical protein [Planctomycetota bacterium]
MVAFDSNHPDVHVCRYSQLDDAYYVAVNRGDPSPLLLALQGKAFQSTEGLRKALAQLGIQVDRQLAKCLSEEAATCRRSTSGTFETM